MRTLNLDRDGSVFCFELEELEHHMRVTVTHDILRIELL